MTTARHSRITKVKNDAIRLGKRPAQALEGSPMSRLSGVTYGDLVLAERVSEKFCGPIKACKVGVRNAGAFIRVKLREAPNVTRQAIREAIAAAAALCVHSESPKSCRIGVKHVIRNLRVIRGPQL